MSVPSSALLRMHLDYTAWASTRLLDAAKQLTREELTRDFGTSDKSVLGTLVHVFAADRVWLGRVKGLPPAGFVSEDDYSMEVLDSAWPEVQAGWRGWAAELGEEDFTQDVTYKDLKGNEHRTPIWQVILHLVNHGTHHRGQAMGFLRSMGKIPPPLDLIYYYRKFASGSAPR